MNFVFLFKLKNQIDECLNEQRKLIGEREELIEVIKKGTNELKKFEVEMNEFHKLYPEYNNNNHSLVTFSAILVYNMLLTL